MKRYPTSLIWLRRDLRLHDQRALYEACANSSSALPLFVFDPTILDRLTDCDDARVSFIFAALAELQEQLSKRGKGLLIEYGRPQEVIPRVCKKYKIAALFANEDYEPAAIERDEQVKNELAKLEIDCHFFTDHLVIPPRSLLNQQERPYQVFTPYKNAWLAHLSKHPELLNSYTPDLAALRDRESVDNKIHSLEQIHFKPHKTPQTNPADRLESFFKNIQHYGDQRDFPATLGTSRLSVHLRFGIVSVRELVLKAQLLQGRGSEIWLSEIIWREFYAMILTLFPHVVQGSFRPAYDAIAWPNRVDWFEMWCAGKTGFPIVDAGMRELNTTGWMHNRLRMITASFLCKTLLVDWRWGESYFARKLLDFDLASNNGGWQWCSSSGCDATPYFRIFNPLIQSKKFDPHGEYIAQFVPELRVLKGSQKIHEGVHGLIEYPEPIVDYKEQRAKCLALYKDHLS